MRISSVLFFIGLAAACGMAVSANRLCRVNDIFENGDYTTATIPQDCTTLLLTDTDIGGAAAIGEALAGNTAVTLVNMARIGDGGAAEIAEALKSNTVLQELFLTSNNISDAGAAAIGEALKVNTALTTLDLQITGIGDVGAAAIGEALEVNTALTWLNLNGNNIGDVGAAAIAEMLKVNTVITSMGLGNNAIGDVGADAIGEALMVTTNTSLTMLDLCDNDISDSVRLKTSNSELEVTCVPVDIETTETPKQVQPVSAGWCSWIQCADSYDTRSADEQAVFCHAEKGNCEGACAQGEGAGAKWCTESTNTGGCPSMCLSEEAADCDKECTPCLANALGTTTSGKACSTCTSCLEYAVCASCGEDALFQSAFIAAMTELGLTVTEITAFGEMVEGLPENSPLEKLLNAAGEKAFGETDTPPTLEAMTAAMKTFFASAEFRTELKSTKLFFWRGY